MTRRITTQLHSLYLLFASIYSSLLLFNCLDSNAMRNTADMPNAAIAIHITQSIVSEGIHVLMQYDTTKPMSTPLITMLTMTLALLPISMEVSRYSQSLAAP